MISWLKRLGRALVALPEALALDARIAQLRAERDRLEEQVNAATEALRELAKQRQ